MRITVNYAHATGNFTTILAESWMCIRSKFDSGKQINRVQSSLLCCNLGPSWGPEACEKAIGTPPDVFMVTGQNDVQHCEKDRKWKAKEWRKRAKYSAASVDNSISSQTAYSR